MKMLQWQLVHLEQQRKDTDYTDGSGVVDDITQCWINDRDSKLYTNG
jgi:hypothetical protein